MLYLKVIQQDNKLQKFKFRLKIAVMYLFFPIKSALSTRPPDLTAASSLLLKAAIEPYWQTPEAGRKKETPVTLRSYRRFN